MKRNDRLKKTLFIFSDDFGELVLLRLLSYQLPFHVHAALPARLYDHVSLSSVIKHRYNGYAELKKIIQTVAPEQVMLFSAYLLAPNGMLSYEEFYSLLDLLDAQQIPVATSDPFMRIYDQQEYQSDQNHYLTNARNILKKISERLSVYRHLYAVPVSFDGAPHQSFSNSAKMTMKLSMRSRRQWTFVMAKEDFSLLQVGSEKSYHKVLAPFLSQLTENHDIAVNLIFPEALLEILKNELPDEPHIKLVSYCDLEEFEKLIIQSEALFYWNVFSASTLLCRLYEKPVFYLGLGHMAVFYPEFYDYIKDSWFPDSKPDVLTLDEAFAPAVMKKLEDGGNQCEDTNIYLPYPQLDSPMDVFTYNSRVV